MAKIKVESDFGFVFETEEEGFGERVNRASVLERALNVMTLEADKYIPDEIEGPEEPRAGLPKPPK